MMNDLGQKIKNYMAAKNMSQTNFSALTKILPHKLNLSLNGHRRFTFEEYEVICYCLGVGVDEFLEPHKPPKKWKEK